MFSAMRFAALSLALLLLGVSYSAAMAHPHTASLVGSRFARCGLCRSAAVKCCDGEMDGVVDGDEDPVVRSCTPMRSHFVVSGTGQPLPERFEMKVLALQGKFSPEDGAADTEHSDDLLLDGEKQPQRPPRMQLCRAHAPSLSDLFPPASYLR
uniref:Selenoprotein F/M domain-containing protein n=1 Tax=Chrysotila carterae TaxID=13221 RepID=A0A7S4F1C9_CHRCT